MRSWAALAAVLVAAALVLAAPARVVWGGDRVRLLVDTDPHYHVLRAERMLRGPSGSTWWDPSLDWPHGAPVPWPPLFDAVLAAAAWLSGADTRDEVARAAAVVPALLGLLSIALAAAFARAVGGAGAARAAAAVLALLPAHAALAVVGRVDQHVAEVLLATGVALAFVRGLRAESPSPGAAVALGGAIALSFWVWMGSTLCLVAPAATISVARLAGLDAVARAGARTLGTGAALAAAALAVSIPALGPPGALGRTSVLSISGLHVAILAGLAGFAALVAWRARRAARPAARAAEVALALAVPAALLLGAWPALREGVRGGLVALAAANPWYSDIREFRPLLLSGVVPLAREVAEVAGTLGLVPAAALLAVPAGRDLWRAAPGARPAVLHLGVWAVTTLALALGRIRFAGYVSVPLAVCAAVGASWAGARIADRLARPPAAPWLAAAMLLASLSPAATALWSVAGGRVRVPDAWIEASTALRSLPSPGDGRDGVAGPWSLGHLVQFYADRPVLATPFGTEAGPRALPDWARFLFATDEAEAEAVLLARRVGNLVLRNPSHEVVGLRGFAPPSAPPALHVTRHPWRGEVVAATPRFTELVASRLYFADGGSASGAAIEGFRLVWESATTAPRHPLLEERLKIYELVAGAELRVAGASPGAIATARVDVATSTGRRFRWSTLRRVAADGTASFRVPYATGPNGSVVASACEVAAGGARAAAILPDAAVESGAPVELRLGPVIRGRR